MQKYYDKKSNTFKIKIGPAQKETYNNFQDFYEACSYDLDNADLIDFTFTKDELENVNYKGSFLNSQTEINLGIYNDSFYLELMDIFKNDDRVATIYPLEGRKRAYGHNSLRNDFNVYYMSDLFFEYQIIKKYKTINKREARSYIYNILNPIFCMGKKRPPSQGTNYLVLCGNICSNTEILKICFECCNSLFPGKVIFIPGNYELWNMSTNDMKKIAGDRNIIYLENELFVIYDNGCSEKLLPMDLYEIPENMKLVIYGTLGFCGLNETYNFNSFIYKDSKSLASRAEEVELSQIRNNVYKFLVDSIPHEKLVIASSMPLTDWSNNGYYDDIRYIEGHDIYNRDLFYEEVNVLGRLELHSDYEVKIKEFSDGIHCIELSDYKKFCRLYGKTIKNIERYEDDCKIIMLKKNEIYFFVLENSNDEIYLLSNEKTSEIPNIKLNYFYDNLEKEYDLKTKKFDESVEKIRYISLELANANSNAWVNKFNQIIYKDRYMITTDLEHNIFYVSEKNDEGISIYTKDEVYSLLDSNDRDDFQKAFNGINYMDLPLDKDASFNIIRNVHKEYLANFKALKAEVNDHVIRDWKFEILPYEE